MIQMNVFLLSWHFQKALEFNWNRLYEVLLPTLFQQNRSRQIQRPHILPHLFLLFGRPTHNLPNIFKFLHLEDM